MDVLLLDDLNNGIVVDISLALKLELDYWLGKYKRFQMNTDLFSVTKVEIVFAVVMPIRL